MGGRLYYPTDPELLHQRLACRAKLKAFNNSDGMTTEEQRQRLLLIESIVGSFSGSHPPIIEPPLNCDYVSPVLAARALQLHAQQVHGVTDAVDMMHILHISWLAHVQGYNLHMGEDVYMNFGCVLLDCNLITIGAHHASLHSA